MQPLLPLAAGVLLGAGLLLAVTGGAVDGKGCPPEPSYALRFTGERVSSGNKSPAYPYGLSLRYTLVEGPSTPLGDLVYEFAAPGHETEKPVRKGNLRDAATPEGAEGVRFVNNVGSPEALDVGDVITLQRVDKRPLLLWRGDEQVGGMVHATVDIQLPRAVFRVNETVQGGRAYVVNPSPSALVLSSVDGETFIEFLGSLPPKLFVHGSRISDFGSEPNLTVEPGGRFDLGMVSGWLPSSEDPDPPLGPYRYVWQHHDSFYAICGEARFELVGPHAALPRGAVVDEGVRPLGDQDGGDGGALRVPTLPFLAVAAVVVVAASVRRLR